MADASGGNGFDGAKLVTGGLALVSTTTALVGSFTGAVPRLLRNNPGYFTVGVIIVLAAIVLSFTASEIGKPSTAVKVDVSGSASNTTTTTTTSDATGLPARIVRIVLTSLSLAAFAIASGVFITGLNRSIAAGDQPRLSANWTYPPGQQPVLTVHMQLDDLTAYQTVYVNVVSLGESITTPVYRSQTGTDADGVADETFDVPPPVGSPGLQVIASVDRATTCQGNPVPELALPKAANASQINSNVSASPSPAAEATTPVPAPPVRQSRALTFSCIQLVAPASLPKPTTSASTSK